MGEKGDLEIRKGMTSYGLKYKVVKRGSWKERRAVGGGEKRRAAGGGEELRL